MPVRKAEAEWRGDLKRGEGKLWLGRGVPLGDYSAASRFEAGKGGNPEELIGAAHAGCFSMALAGILAEAGHTPQRIHTTAAVHLEKEGDRFSITRIDLHTEVAVPGMSDQEFQEKALQAKVDCPVSRALAATAITLEAKLVPGEGG
ncbi:MAG: OsmC family protein [Armatimonadetes bacterium]|nr:OsmC family protein [Armatimonadota bacterium]